MKGRRYRKGKHKKKKDLFNKKKKWERVLTYQSPLTRLPSCPLGSEGASANQCIGKNCLVGSNREKEQGETTKGCRTMVWNLSSACH